MIRKTIIIPTNINNKLSCETFVHITMAPGPLKMADLEETEIEIRTADNSHPPVLTKLVDLGRVSLEKIPTAVTWQSHGMDAFDFIKGFTKEHKDTHGGTPMGIYIYKKI